MTIPPEVQTGLQTMAYLVAIVGVSVAISVSAISQFLRLRKEVIERTEDERKRIEVELRDLGKNEEEIRGLVRRIDRSRLILETYQSTWKAFLFSAICGAGSALSALFYPIEVNPMNYTGALLILALAALIYAFVQLWQLMKSLGPN